MRRWHSLLLAAALLCSGAPAAAQDEKDPPAEWTRPDTVRLEGAGAFAHPKLMPGEDALYITAHTVYHPQLVGNPSLVNRSERYQSSTSLWAGQVTDLRFKNVTALPQPSGDFLYLYPEGEVGPEGVFHLAWAEANPDSVAKRQSLADRVPAKEVYYARFGQEAWFPPEGIYRSEGTEEIWGGAANVRWGRDQKGTFQLGPDGTPHFVLNHQWRGSMVHVWKRSRGAWQIDTIRYDPKARARLTAANRNVPIGSSCDLAIGESGRLALAYSASRTAKGLSSNEVRVAHTSDGGDTWKRTTILDPKQRINNEKGSGSVRHLELTGRPGDTLHVVWGRKTSELTFSAQELWHAWSADGGETWTTTSPIDLPENGHLDDLEMVTGSNGTPHVLVHLGGGKDNDASTSDLLHTRWRPERGWAELQALTPASKHVHGATFAVWGGRLHLLWSQTPLPFEYTSPVTILRRSHPLPSKSTSE